MFITRNSMYRIKASQTHCIQFRKQKRPTDPVPLPEHLTSSGTQNYKANPETEILLVCFYPANRVLYNSTAKLSNKKKV